MPGLNTSLSIAVQALEANQGALNVTSNNIANVNTPGYSRQVAILNEAPTFQENNITFGGGVTLEQFQSVRDQLLQLRIYEETQQQGNSETQFNSLSQIEGIFSDPSQGVGGALSAFFNSLSQLSTNPTDANARQAVLTSANNLANSFHQAASSLTTIGTGLDQSVPQTVDQINRLTSQIATLNGQVAQMQGLGKDPGTVQDQRDELIRQLSGLVNISVTQTEHGLTLTTANGVPLVVANQSYGLQANANNSVLEHVFSAQGQDITSQIQGGQLGGTLQVRDQALPQLFTQLNDLASQFATSFNMQHAAGFDAAGNAGQNFFNPLPTTTDAAASFGVAITDPGLIAASSDGSAGSNGNLEQLVALRNQQLPAGANPMDLYSNLVLQVGNLGANAKAAVTATNLSLQQLTDQRSSVSGVSLDEETTNMIKYQRAYEAGARVVTTVDSMLQTLMSMGVTT
ncbi:MAG: flagellar hook-associated protein FlgK [Acidobacteriia bacterium]|jgi:flagellar hook-associated protein 1 FlgK|nr:flagellar hook-associated protein FlgK [Terriglobia bacterium]